MSNTILFLFNVLLAFAIGLGITQLIDALASGLSINAGIESGMIIHSLGFILDMLFAMTFIVIGCL